MLRTLSIVTLGIVLVLAAASSAQAARSRGRVRSLNGTFTGTVTRLIRTQMSFETDSRTYTVNYDQNTSVTGGSKKGTIDDLEIGMNVKVVVKNNRADKIEVQLK